MRRGAGFLPSPLLDGASGNGKIVRREQSGKPTHLEYASLFARFFFDKAMPRLTFITAVPQNIERGSGCYVGTWTLLKALRQCGTEIEVVAPRIAMPAYAATRMLFNEGLRFRRFDGDVTIGIDADGYTMARWSRRSNVLPHVACIKGVLGDAVPYERGVTRLSLRLQAELEARHARNADLVITTSRYCAQRIEELYRVKDAVVVPELIDLSAWRKLFRANPFPPDSRKFTVLSVCRFYRRKRLDVLLRAAAIAVREIPELAIRIVGNGPEGGRLRRLARKLGIERLIAWVGDAGIDELAAEYNRADVFCLPSAQEGFGIVFLEAMAAGKPIIAAHAAAVPEVVRHGILVERDNPEALAVAIVRLHRDPELRKSLSAAGLGDVEAFEMGRVARQFLKEAAKVAPGAKIGEKSEVEYAI